MGHQRIIMNYYKVSNGHVIEHVLVGQNRGFTLSIYQPMMGSIISSPLWMILLVLLGGFC